MMYTKWGWLDLTLKPAKKQKYFYLFPSLLKSTYLGILIWCGAKWEHAVTSQETQSIPGWLSIPTLCFFLSTCLGSLEFHSPHRVIRLGNALVKNIGTVCADFICCALLAHISLLCFCTRCGGTVGAILTCPLEVVKTRLQSSSITLYVSEVQLSTVNGASVARVSPPGPLHCLKWVSFNMSHTYTQSIF